ncbi:MAG: hydroxyphenylacetyl-CoA thioesterase PaaI [Gammaproteobacteria bacterium]|nr:hydroxyphenylacetyl-CoA thioesterase PaaI [Gammaproteobacteria bacterium]
MDKLERARRCAEKMYANDRASRALGIDISTPAPASAVATMRVREDMVNGFDICHGGLVFTLADTAFAFACNAYDDLTVAASASIDFLRPARLDDELRAVAREDRRGKRVSFYTIEVFNQDDELVALFRGRSVSRGERILEDE